MGLSSLGLDMNMLMGPEGTIATDLVSLLGNGQDLNAIEQASFAQQVSADAE
jgi:hypothetical protein